MNMKKYLSILELLELGAKHINFHPDVVCGNVKVSYRCGKDGKEGYGVFNLNDKVIVEVGVYDYVDGFRNGVARVKKDSKWGIINEQGDEVHNVVYDFISKFYERDYDTIEFRRGNNHFKASVSNPTTLLPYDHYYKTDTYWVRNL